MSGRTFCPGGVDVTTGAGYHTDSLTATDNKVASGSYWFYDGGINIASHPQEIMEVDWNTRDVPNSQLGGDTNQRGLEISLAGPTGGQLSWGTDSGPFAPGNLPTLTWYHVLWSGNIQTGECDLLINGVRNFGGSSNFATGNIAWNGKSLDLFYDPDGNHNSDVHGFVAEYWLAPGQSLLGLDGLIAPETAAKFYSDGCPVDLGSDGSTPTGTAPAVYLRRSPTDPASNFGINRGTGGSLSIVGAPIAVDGPCACDAAAQRVQGHVF